MFLQRVDSSLVIFEMHELLRYCHRALHFALLCFEVPFLVVWWKMVRACEDPMQPSPFFWGGVILCEVFALQVRNTLRADIQGDYQDAELEGGDEE